MALTMVLSTLVIYLTLVAFGSCLGETSIDDYVYWKKEDIKSWHVYFLSRAFEEERLTNVAAVAAVNAMANGLRQGLHNVVLYQGQELETAKLMMEGTSAQGCVKGVSSFIRDSIDEEMSNYYDCSADAPSNLNRVYRNENITYSKYNTTYDRSLQGIDICAKTYPNKDSRSRLIMCVDSWYNLYFKKANNTSYNVHNSPSMSIFVNTVLPCAENAAKKITISGWKFLRMLVQCAKLSKNIDYEDYEKNVIQGYYSYVTESNLALQVRIAQGLYKDNVDEMEQDMLNYYNMQKNALEKYVIGSRDQQYYYNITHGYLQKYFFSVSSTGIDNPANLDCVMNATKALNDVVIKASKEALEYDRHAVNETKDIFVKIYNLFFRQNKVLPSVGNPAILNCFANGYIFEEKTILDCSILTVIRFIVNYTETKNRIKNHINKQLDYENIFFSSSSLPGEDALLSNAYLGADLAMYELQRCLYINSGTKYVVNTFASSFNLTAISQSYNY